MSDLPTVLIRTNHHSASVYLEKGGRSDSVRLINCGEHASVVKKTMLIAGTISINTYDLSRRIDPSCKTPSYGARNGQSLINPNVKAFWLEVLLNTNEPTWVEVLASNTNDPAAPG